MNRFLSLVSCARSGCVTGLAFVLIVLFSSGAWALVTQDMEDQAEEALSTLLSENDGVDPDQSGPLADFLSKWLDVPGTRLRAALIKPFLSDYRREVTVPDSNQIYAWIEGLCATPHRRPGSDYGHQAEQWLYDTFVDMGLENVHRDPIPIGHWEADSWSLSVDGEDIPCFFSVKTAFTGDNGITAPLVYVGLGREASFDRVDVKDKIVVLEVLNAFIPTGALLAIPGSNYFVSDPDDSINVFTRQYLSFFYLNLKPRSEWEWAPEASGESLLWDAFDEAVSRGARGVAMILSNKQSKYNSQYGIYDGRNRDVPGVWVGKYDGIRLRCLAAMGKTATLTLTGSQGPGTMSNVWGVLPGMSDENIVICSHQDSSFKGVVEDGAGIAQVLAQAWAWSRVPRENRPKTLVFVAAAGHLYGGLGGYRFGYDHPDIMKNTWLVFNLEHLASREVEERLGDYQLTGDVAPSIIWTTENPRLLAALQKAVDQRPAKRMVSLPATYFGSPVSDVTGYIKGAEDGGFPDIPILSWAAAPYYLLDEMDTFDKIDKDELKPVAETVTEIIKNFMAMRLNP